MTIKFNRWILGLAATLALLLFFVAGGVVGYMYAGDGGPNAGATASLPVDSGSGPSKEEVWKPFWETYELVHKEFYGRPVDEKKLMNAATQGMVSSLGDPYTSYLPPAEHARAQEELRGRFEGIGVYVDVKNKQFLIVAPIEDSPAAKAGLKSGDVITAVNGEKITGLDQQVVIGKIRGPKGTSVMLTIKRGNQPLFDVKVMRDEIRVAQVKYTLIQNDIAYIDVNIFGDQTTLELDNALRQAKQDGAKGVVLDLRDNGGGWVNAAREMLGRFLDGGVAMYEDPTREAGSEKALEVIKGDVSAYDLPMVVLVNKGSASASEIVAGALVARGRATLVGERTFGKGSEQLVHTLSGGSSAHITIAHWLTPDKVDIHGKGLKPKVVVQGGAEDVEGQGPQFNRAVQELRKLIK